MTAPVRSLDPGPENARAVPFQPWDERCCDRAVKLCGGCVCSYLTKCPDHGTRHNGSHD